MEVGGHALKTNITTLGPLVLPFSEQLLFFATLLYRHLFPSASSSSSSKSGTGNNKATSESASAADAAAADKPYIPDYKLAFEHFCIHAASRGILDQLQSNLASPTPTSRPPAPPSTASATPPPAASGTSSAILRLKGASAAATASGNSHSARGSSATARCGAQ
uniref:FAE domain-containing protein n=1 Tax=Ananas comosus var. bracteatus TaxID=296719 RepID=A0A6V7Q4D4_ANACO|nr:unnamed protein product [Ananas comosus var. bracteatus]